MDQKDTCVYVLYMAIIPYLVHWAVRKFGCNALWLEGCIECWCYQVSLRQVQYRVWSTNATTSFMNNGHDV